jgi:hypothetical protein
MKAKRKYSGCFPKPAANSGSFQRDACLENYAGELTAIAYGVALQHGLGASWLDVELDLWAALTQVVKQLDSSSVLSPGRKMATQPLS